MSMELDTKESELETIQLKLAHINLDTASLSSGTGDFNELVHHEETSLEGKQNTLSFCLLFVHILVFFRLVTNPFKAKYSSSRLEKVVRHRFFQENHFLPFRNRATKCRSNTNSWSKVSLLKIFAINFAFNGLFTFALQQSIPCAVSYPRWCHSRRSQRYPKNIPGKQISFCILFSYLFTLILFFRFCTLVKESLVNPKTTSGTTASPPSSPPPATSWWTSRSPVRVRSKIDCYKIQSFSSFTFDFFQVCYSWKGTSSSRSHITCPPPATSALSPCGRPSDPHPR